jgi:hypothetical protein
MRPTKEYFFDSAQRDSLGREYISCPEGGEPLVVEDGGDGRMLAFCYRHVVACLVGKGWDKKELKRE